MLHKLLWICKKWINKKTSYKHDIKLLSTPFPELSKNSTFSLTWYVFTSVSPYLLANSVDISSWYLIWSCYVWEGKEYLRKLYLCFCVSNQLPTIVKAAPSVDQFKKLRMCLSNYKNRLKEYISTYLFEKIVSNNIFAFLLISIYCVIAWCAICCL